MIMKTLLPLPQSLLIWTLTLMLSFGFSDQSYGSCDCPTGGIVVDASTETLSTSSLPAGSFNGIACIQNGTFVIDDDYTFDGANIYFEDFAQLEIEDGHTLSILNGSKLEACSGMWESIIVQDGANLIVQSHQVSLFPGIYSIKAIFTDGNVDVRQILVNI